MTVRSGVLLSQLRAGGGVGARQFGSSLQGGIVIKPRSRQVWAGTHGFHHRRQGFRVDAALRLFAAQLDFGSSRRGAAVDPGAGRALRIHGLHHLE